MIYLLRLLTALLFSLIVVLMVCACGDARGGNQGGHAPGVGSTLVSIGLWFTWAGSFALGIGIIGRVACLVMPALAGFAELLSDLAVIGLATLLLGTSFIWLGNNAWLLAVVVVLLLALIGFRYRVRLARLLRLKKGPAKPVAA